MGITKTKRLSKMELLDKVIPDIYAEEADESLYEAYKAGFSKAWNYKEIERRCAEASAKSWRWKYENEIKKHNTGSEGSDAT